MNLRTYNSSETKASVILLILECETPKQEQLPRDCYDVQQMGKGSDGVYTVYTGNPPKAIQVYCDMTTEGGGWLVCTRIV